MNNERIYTLLEKYWNCETSVSEEQELQAFFNFDLSLNGSHSGGDSHQLRTAVLFTTTHNFI